MASRMDDFLVGIIAMFAQVFFDAGLAILSEVLASILTRASGRTFKSISDVNPVTRIFALGMLGALVGFLSVVAYPHPLVHQSRLHGVSVVLSPLIAGFAMSQLGRLLRRYGKRVMPIESFGYGFVFAFGMAVVRFLMLR